MSLIKLVLGIDGAFFFVNVCFFFLDSPMDMSIVESEERTVNVNEVTDYASEIHTHLRAMEVCMSVFGSLAYKSCFPLVLC